MKKVLVKCAGHKLEFIEQTNISLPPTPTIKRWNTWLWASYFYATNFTKTKNFVETLENDENKEVDTNDLLFQQLEFII